MQSLYAVRKKKTQKTLENNPFKKGIVTIFDSSLKINRHVDLIHVYIKQVQFQLSSCQCQYIGTQTLQNSNKQRII